MRVEDVFSIKGRGTVVTGRVEIGEARVGDEVRFQNKKGATIRTQVAGIETFKKVVQVAAAGDNVGLLLRKVTRDDIETGATIESA